MTSRDEKTWGTLAHLGGLIGTFVIPFPLAGNIIGALIFWLIKRNESAFVDDQGREAINFQITISILSLIFSILSWIAFSLWTFTFWSWGNNDFDNGFGPHFFRPHFFSFGWSGLSGILWILNLVFSIIGAVRASKGIAYRYPVSLRIVK